MCCKDFCAGFLSVIYSIVQGWMHGSLCMFGLSVYYCEYVPEKKTMAFLLYATYFWSENCTTVREADLPFDTHRVPTKKASIQPMKVTTHRIIYEPIKYPKEAVGSHYTFVIMVLYIVLDVIWAGSATLLLLGVLLQIRRSCSIIFYLPWLLSLVLLVFLDAVATLIYAKDISSSFGYRGWFVTIGGLDKGNSTFDGKYVGPITQAPSLIMTVISCRGIIFWILNLHLLIRISKATGTAVRGTDLDYYYSYSSSTLTDEPV